MTDDPPTVACIATREALSAILDGETPPVGDAAVDRHLADCTACSRYARRLDEAGRRLAIARAEPVPDNTATILAALATEAQDDRRIRDLRVLVGLVGILQLVAGVTVLLGSAGALHTGRELAALQLAIGAGLVLAALQPWRADGLLPVMVVLVAIMAVVGVVDVVSGVASLAAELTHVAELVGVLALRGLVRRSPPSDARWGVRAVGRA